MIYTWFQQKLKKKSTYSNRDAESLEHVKDAESLEHDALAARLEDRRRQVQTAETSTLWI